MRLHQREAQMIPAKTPTGPTVYLIHFNQRYHHSQHYIGFTAEDLAARLERHAAGQGARLMEVIAAAGITWRCVRTWTGGRVLERRLKNRKDAPKVCPVCAGEKANGRANYEK